jgi:head-tail adaptor
MKSNIKRGDLRDIVEISNISQYNDPTTGAPKKTFGTPFKIYAKVRSAIGVNPDADDKNTQSTSLEVIVIKESHQIETEDRLTFGDKHFNIKLIEDMDIYFKKLICFRAL